MTLPAAIGVSAQDDDTQYTLAGPARAPYAVKTSSGHALGLSLSVSGPTSTSTASLIEITLANRAQAPESDTWAFFERAADVSVGPDGSASVGVSRQELGRFGHVRLVFTPSSSAPESCGSGTGTVYAGVITGAITFYTNTARKVGGRTIPGWGSFSVGPSHFVMGTAKAPATLVASQGCVPPSVPPPCFAGISFFSPNYEFSGESPASSSTGSITATATFHLHVPSGSAYRTSAVTKTTPPLRFSAPTLAVNAGGAGRPITGRAAYTAASSTPSHFTRPCLRGSILATQEIDDYSLPPMVWENRMPPVVARYATGGRATQPNVPDGYGSIDVNKVAAGGS